MSDMLSQEEINALLSGVSLDDSNDADDTTTSSDETDGIDLDNLLTSQEKDVLGELGNISIGTSATTLFALLGQRVIITTPEVSVVKLRNLGEDFERPCVGIRVDYVEGIKGTNVLLMNNRDVKVITSLMMGWGGDINEEEPLNDMDISAIQECMNQMIGSSSTSLASLVDTKIDIATPVAKVLDFNSEEILQDLGFDEEYAVCITFRMEIGTLVDSNIMQLLPMEFANRMVGVMTSFMTGGAEMPEEAAKGSQAAAAAQAPQAQPAPQQPAPPAHTPPPQAPQQPQQQMHQGEGAPMANTMYAPPMDAGQQMYQQPPPGYYAPPGYHMPPPGYVPPQPVATQPAQFQSFDVGNIMQQKENIEIIMDVPLDVTVELGRTSRKIKDILEFSPGSIIELNKLAGEPIDILVNGKFVAKGEVVVIDENFGIRVTDIVNAEHRI